MLLGVQHPLWPHHVVVLVAPLALLAGGIVAAWPPRRAVAGAVAGFVTVVVFLAAISTSVNVRRLQQPFPNVQGMVAALRSCAQPSDLMVTDDQFAAALADRSTPPELVDTSRTRIRSGDLTVQQVEANAGRPDVCAVLLATGRLSEFPGFEDWVRQRFPVVRDQDNRHVLYLRERQTVMGPDREGPMTGLARYACSDAA